MRLHPLRILGIALALAAAAAASSPVLAGDTRVGAARDATQEAELDKTLGGLAPGAVSIFHDANAAMDAHDYEGAAAAYAKVHAAAPSFVAGTRRLCLAQARSGRADEGVQHCREALEAEATAENHAALAAAIVQKHPLMPPELKEAFDEATAAVKLKPDADYTQLTLCEVAFDAQDLAAIDGCSAKLQQIAPGEATTHFFVAVDLAGHADVPASRAELEVAKQKGIDPKLYAVVRSQLDLADRLAKPETPTRILTVVKQSLFGWLAGLLALAVVGLGLGAAVKRLKASAPGVVRGALAAVLGLGVIYFYLSLVVICLATAGTVAAFAYAGSMQEKSMVVQVLLVGSVFVYGTFALARAMTAYDDDGPLGAVADLAVETRLRELLDEVADTIGTRPVDAVYVTEGASIEIIDRGGGLAHLFGRGERALVVGQDVFGRNDLRVLRRKLAGEYGKGRRRGAAGGAVAVPMQRGLRRALADNKSSMNPARWMLSAYGALYGRMASGAGVLQQVLAERWADDAYGDEAEERDDDDEPGWSLFEDRQAMEAQVRARRPAIALKVKDAAKAKAAEAKAKAIEAKAKAKVAPRKPDDEADEA